MLELFYYNLWKQSVDNDTLLYKSYPVTLLCIIVLNINTVVKYYGFVIRYRYGINLFINSNSANYKIYNFIYLIHSYSTHVCGYCPYFVIIIDPIIAAVLHFVQKYKKILYMAPNFVSTVYQSKSSVRRSAF